jgi:ferredoxin
MSGPYPPSENSMESALFLAYLSHLRFSKIAKNKYAVSTPDALYKSFYKTIGAAKDAMHSHKIFKAYEKNNRSHLGAIKTKTSQSSSETIEEKYNPASKFHIIRDKCSGCGTCSDYSCDTSEYFGKEDDSISSHLLKQPTDEAGYALCMFAMSLCGSKAIVNNAISIHEHDGERLVSWFEIAKYGLFDKIPREQLAHQTLAYSTTEEESILHTAARHGSLSKVPTELLKKELLTAKNAEGDTPIHIAAVSGYLNQIPAEILRETLLEENAYSNSVIILAANSGNLNQIQRDLLNNSILLSKNRFGSTPIHFAIGKGHINQLPEEFRTEEAITVKDAFGSTPIHYAAENGCINSIPPTLINKDVLLIKDDQGRTPLDLAKLNGNTKNLPAILKQFSKRGTALSKKS